MLVTLLGMFTVAKELGKIPRTFQNWLVPMEVLPSATVTLVTGMDKKTL